MGDKKDEGIFFKCPNCQVQLKAPKNTIGKHAACPGCSEKIFIPDPDKQKDNEEES